MKILIGFKVPTRIKIEIIYSMRNWYPEKYNYSVYLNAQKLPASVK